LNINLHNHTTFSDGLLTVGQIVEAAISSRLTHVGIADHFEGRKLGGRGIGPSNMAEYLGEIRRWREKVRSEICVLAGVEVDFCRNRTDFALLREGRVFEGLDFVLFEYVNEPLFDGDSLNLLLEIKRFMPCPVGLAHPRIEDTFSEYLPEAAAGLAAENQIFIELCPGPRNACFVPLPDDVDEAQIRRRIRELNRQLEELPKNLEGEPDERLIMRKAINARMELDALLMRQEVVPAYRVRSNFNERFFKAVKKFGTMISIGTDTHELPDEVGDIADAVSFIKEHQLERNIVTEYLWKGR